MEVCFYFRVCTRSFLKLDSTKTILPHGFSKIGFLEILGNILRDIIAILFPTKLLVSNIGFKQSILNVMTHRWLILDKYSFIYIPTFPVLLNALPRNCFALINFFFFLPFQKVPSKTYTTLTVTDTTKQYYGSYNKNVQSSNYCQKETI